MKPNGHGSMHSSDRDSLTPNSATVQGPYGLSVKLSRIGKLIVAYQWATSNADFQSGGLTAVEKIPEGYRPLTGGCVIFNGNNGDYCNWKINSDGSIITSGNVHKGYILAAVGVWIAA